VEDNIKMDLEKTVKGCGLVGQDMGPWWALVNTVMYYQIPSKEGNLTS
jgi:hypothetical protein